MCCVMLRRVVLLYRCCVVAVLCYAVVCCAVVWCGVLCCALRCAALRFVVLPCCAVLSCAVLTCAVLCWAALRLLPPSSFPPSSSPSSFNFQCMHWSAALLLSGTFLCLLLLLWVLLLLLVLLFLVGNFGPLQLHASTTFKNVRASRSLLRQVFFEGPGGSFFRVFFLHRFLMVFCSILEGLGELYGSQNGGNIDAKLC